VIFLSSHKGDGVSNLRETIAKLMYERDRQVFDAREWAKQAPYFILASIAEGGN